MPYLQNQPPWIRYGITFVLTSLTILAIDFLPVVGEWKRGGLLLPFFCITAVTFWLGRNAGIFSAVLSIGLMNRTNLFPVWNENIESAISINSLCILLSVITIVTISYQEKLLKKLSDTQQDLKLAQNVGKIGNWRLNLNPKRLLWSDEVYKIFGIPIGTPMSYEYFLSKVHPEDKAIVDKAWQAALNGQTYDIEHRILVHGEVKWIHEKAVLDYSEDGQVTGGFGIAQDISDRKNAEFKLLEQDSQLQLIMNLTPSLICYFDKDLRYVRVNRTYENFWCVAADQIIGQTVRDVIGEEPWVIVKPHIEKALNGERATFDQQISFRDGTSRWVCVTYVPDFENKGKVKGIVGHVADIEDRIRKERALREAEERIRLATESTGVGIWEWNIITNQLRWDAQLFKIYGLPPTEDGFIPYSLWSNAVLPEDIEQIENIVKKTIDIAGYSTSEFNILRANDNAIRTIQTTQTTRLNAEGAVEWVLGTNLDITQQKEAEKTLVEKEMQLKLIMNLIPALISYLDIDFRYIRVNKVYEQWFGLAMKDIIGRTALEIVGENAWAVAAPYFEAARLGQKSIFDNRLIFFDKTIHWVQTTVIPDIDADGQVKGLLIHAADINDRKHYEQQISNLNDSLKIKADELQLIFDTVPIGLAITHDTEGMHIRGNKVLENTIGLTWRSELSLRSVAPQAYQVYENNKQLSVNQLPMQRAVRGETVTNQMLEIRRPEGKSITVLTNANPLFDKAGNITGAVGAFQDITELKRLQDTFLQSHQLLQTLIEQASIGIAMFDHDMNYLVSSPKWSLDHGVNPLNLAGLNHYKLFPDLPAEWKQYHQRGLAGEFINNEMDFWIRADGSQRWLRWSLGPWTALDRTIGGIIICCEDITDRKLVEDNLQASELRVSIALEELKAGYWDWEFKTNAVYFSPVWKQQLGFTENEIPNRYEEWEQRLHPGDRQIALDMVKQHLAGKSPTFEMEFRLLHKNGTYRNIHSHGALIRDENNEPYRMVGIHLDVTDYRKVKQLEYQQKLLDETAELFVATQTAIAIAHDLNQPLNAVVHFADAAVELFKTGDASQQMLIYALENCSEQAYRAGKVIPQLIGVLNKSEHIDVNEKVDINQVIDETLILLKNSHFYDAVNTELILESGLPPIKISRLHLQKVVYNLMQNGYDAMIDFGKINGILRIVTRKFPDVPDTLEVIIRDEGTGVTNKNQLKKIFQPFYTTKKMGSGMGLAICQDLIKASGGELWAEQNIGPGLSLHVTLPFIK